MKKIIFILLTTFLVTTSNNAQDSGGKFSGYMFGDYYYVVKNHDESLVDLHGYQFRRIYFTYDYKIDNAWSTRLRLEMGNKFGVDKGVKMSSVVIDAYLKYKIGLQSIILGISPTPTWKIVEKIWGYRSVEKTPLDIQKMGGSRDFGLAAEGYFNTAKSFGYSVMFSNGSSTKQETNRGKSGMASISWKPNKSLIFELYGDYFDKKGSTDWITLQGFAAYVSKNFRVGLQYANQTREINEDKSNKFNIASAFLTGRINEKFGYLLRADKMFEANPKGSDIAFIPFSEDAASTLLIAGFDWSPVKGVSIIPNIEYVLYDKTESGVTIENDMFARLTFYWKFK